MKEEHFRRMLPISLMYVGVLVSSMIGLSKVSVATVVIGRSLIPFGTGMYISVWSITTTTIIMLLSFRAT